MEALGLSLTALEAAATPLAPDVPLVSGAASRDESSPDAATGEASLSFPSGFRYTGALVRGLRHGEGQLQLPTGGIVRATFVDGEAHGLGERSWPDGSWYRGGFARGLRHGHGEHFHARTGSVYVGDWVHGSREGRGSLSYASGAVYEGDWLAGARHGRGMLRFASGNTYVGSWLQDAKSGIGRFTWVAGENARQEYVGEWARDLPEGRGVHTWYADATAGGGGGAAASEEEEGVGPFSGWAVSCRYTGAFSQGYRHGHGRMLYAQGSLYCGSWWADSKHGYGVWVGADGGVFDGAFVSDTPVMSLATLVATNAVAPLSASPPPPHKSDVLDRTGMGSRGSNSHRSDSPGIGSTLAIIKGAVAAGAGGAVSLPPGVRLPPGAPPRPVSCDALFKTELSDLAPSADALLGWHAASRAQREARQLSVTLPSGSGAAAAVAAATATAAAHGVGEGLRSTSTSLTVGSAAIIVARLRAQCETRLQGVLVRWNSRMSDWYAAYARAPMPPSPRGGSWGVGLCLGETHARSPGDAAAAADPGPLLEYLAALSESPCVGVSGPGAAPAGSDALASGGIPGAPLVLRLGQLFRFVRDCGLLAPPSLTLATVCSVLAAIRAASALAITDAAARLVVLGRHFDFKSGESGAGGGAGGGGAEGVSGSVESVGVDEEGGGGNVGSGAIREQSGGGLIGSAEAAAANITCDALTALRAVTGAHISFPPALEAVLPAPPISVMCHAAMKGGKGGGASELASTGTFAPFDPYLPIHFTEFVGVIARLSVIRARAHAEQAAVAASIAATALAEAEAAATAAALAQQQQAQQPMLMVQAAPLVTPPATTVSPSASMPATRVSSATPALLTKEASISVTANTAMTLASRSMSSASLSPSSVAPLSVAVSQQQGVAARPSRPASTSSSAVESSVGGTSIGSGGSVAPPMKLFIKAPSHLSSPTSAATTTFPDHKSATLTTIASPPSSPNRALATFAAASAGVSGVGIVNTVGTRPAPISSALPARPALIQAVAVAQLPKSGWGFTGTVAGGGVQTVGDRPLGSGLYKPRGGETHPHILATSAIALSAAPEEAEALAAITSGDPDGPALAIDATFFHCCAPRAMAPPPLPIVAILPQAPDTTRLADDLQLHSSVPALSWRASLTGSSRSKSPRRNRMDPDAAANAAAVRGGAPAPLLASDGGLRAIVSPSMPPLVSQGGWAISPSEGAFGDGRDEHCVAIMTLLQGDGTSPPLDLAALLRADHSGGSSGLHTASEPCLLPYEAPGAQHLSGVVAKVAATLAAMPLHPPTTTAPWAVAGPHHGIGEPSTNSSATLPPPTLRSLINALRAAGLLECAPEGVAPHAARDALLLRSSPVAAADTATEPLAVGSVATVPAAASSSKAGTAAPSRPGSAAGASAKGTVVTKGAPGSSVNRTTPSTNTPLTLPAPRKGGGTPAPSALESVAPVSPPPSVAPLPPVAVPSAVRNAALRALDNASVLPSFHQSISAALSSFPVLDSSLALTLALGAVAVAPPPPDILALAARKVRVFSQPRTLGEVAEGQWGLSMLTSTAAPAASAPITVVAAPADEGLAEHDVAIAAAAADAQLAASLSAALSVGAASQVLPETFTIPAEEVHHGTASTAASLDCVLSVPLIGPELPEALCRIAAGYGALLAARGGALTSTLSDLDAAYSAAESDLERSLSAAVAAGDIGLAMKKLPGGVASPPRALSAGNGAGRRASLVAAAAAAVAAGHNSREILTEAVSLGRQLIRHTLHLAAAAVRLAASQGPFGHRAPTPPPPPPAPPLERGASMQSVLPPQGGGSFASGSVAGSGSILAGGASLVGVGGGSVLAGGSVYSSVAAGSASVSRPASGAAAAIRSGAGAHVQQHAAEGVGGGGGVDTDLHSPQPAPTASHPHYLGPGLALLPPALETGWLSTTEAAATMLPVIVRALEARRQA